MMMTEFNLSLFSLSFFFVFAAVPVVSSIFRSCLALAGAVSAADAVGAVGAVGGLASRSKRDFKRRRSNGSSVYPSMMVCRTAGRGKSSVSISNRRRKAPAPYALRPAPFSFSFSSRFVSSTTFSSIYCTFSLRSLHRLQPLVGCVREIDETTDSGRGNQVEAETERTDSAIQG